MKTKIVLEFAPIDVDPDELDWILRDLKFGWVREDMYPVTTRTETMEDTP